MAKKIQAVVRLQIEAGKANPAPPIGPALAGHGRVAVRHFLAAHPNSGVHTGLVVAGKTSRIN